MRWIAGPMALMLAVMLAGALGWMLPHLRAVRPVRAGVPAPPPLFMVSELSLPPHGQACMQEVTVQPNSGLAEFNLRPTHPGSGGPGGPPVRLVLTARGYRASAYVPGGYPGGAASVDILPGPPRQAVLASACFSNLGRESVNLESSTEARTISRSSTTVDGKRVAGDIVLAFFGTERRSLLKQLGEAFSHASNLTEGLIPVWLIWVIAILTAIGVPAGMALAMYAALREQAPPRDSPT
jgi:hypothetical protein